MNLFICIIQGRQFYEVLGAGALRRNGGLLLGVQGFVGGPGQTKYSKIDCADYCTIVNTLNTTDFTQYNSKGELYGT